MVEGLPGSDFAGVKTHWRKAIFADIKAADVKAWGRLRCRVAPGPLVRIARCFIVPCFIVYGVFLCPEDVLRR